MHLTSQLLVAGTVVVTLAATSVFAQAPSTTDLLPGDHGRMAGGILPAQIPAGGLPPQSRAPRAPDILLAVTAAQAIAKACKQYKLGIAVVNSEGEPILVYVPNGSGAFHGYSAIRKAYSAIKYQGPTTPMVDKARSDPDFAAKVKADPNLMAFKGGLPLKAGDKIVGAIGVSGAEPGGHDDECGQIGVDKISGQLK